MIEKAKKGYQWVLNEDGTKFVEEKIPGKDIIEAENKRFKESMEKINKRTEREIDSMLLPDPINDILKKALKKIDRHLVKFQMKRDWNDKDMDDFIKYCKTYRVLTKLLNREPLSIFDF